MTTFRVRYIETENYCLKLVYVDRPHMVHSSYAQLLIQMFSAQDKPPSALAHQTYRNFRTLLLWNVIAIGPEVNIDKRFGNYDDAL